MVLGSRGKCGFLVLQINWLARTLWEKWLSARGIGGNGKWRVDREELTFYLYRDGLWCLFGKFVCERTARFTATTRRSESSFPGAFFVGLPTTFLPFIKLSRGTCSRLSPREFAPFVAVRSFVDEGAGETGPPLKALVVTSESIIGSPQLLTFVTVCLLCTVIPSKLAFRINVFNLRPLFSRGR